VLREKSRLNYSSFVSRIANSICCGLSSPKHYIREQAKDDLLELSPDMIVYDPAEDLFEDPVSEDD